MEFINKFIIYSLLFNISIINFIQLNKIIKNQEKIININLSILKDIQSLSYSNKYIKVN
jgi:hypothetical protein